MENVVILLLVAEAAQQTPADARNFGRIQEQILLLRHLDGDGDELAEEPAAAADHAATAHRAEHLRFVADADLAQLDAGVVLAHEVLDQLAEVDAGRRGEVKHQLAAIEENFHIDELHVELAFPDARLAKLVRGVGQRVVLLRRGQVLVRHLAQDIPDAVGRKVFGQAVHNGHHRGDAEALPRFREHAIPPVNEGVLAVKKVYLSVMTEFDTDYALHVWMVSVTGRTA